MSTHCIQMSFRTKQHQHIYRSIAPSPSHTLYLHILETTTYKQTIPIGKAKGRKSIYGHRFTANFVFP